MIPAPAPHIDCLQGAASAQPADQTHAKRAKDNRSRRRDNRRRWRRLLIEVDLYAGPIHGNHPAGLWRGIEMSMNI